MYNAEAQKKYQEKVKKYTVKFTLSDDDRATVQTLDDLILSSGLTANAYIKNVLRDHVNQKLQE